MIKKLILLISILICLAACSASDYNSPKVYQIKDAKLQLKSKIYLLHNKSRLPILVDHPVAHPSASAGWASKIDPNRWSAFMTNRHYFKFTCAVIYSRYKSKKISCAKVLKISQIKILKAPRDFLDTSFWLAENKNYHDIMKRINRRGVWLPQHKWP